MKKAIVLVAVALVIPTSVAFAKANPTRGKSNPTVMYVLKGALSSYQAATSAGPGSISITVAHSNFHNSLVSDQTLTFATTMSTRVTMKNGATAITDGAKGVLKFKAPLHRKGDTTLMTTLTTNAKALHIIDQSRH
ncbi:MAG TPA: hypothetical protein VFU33_09880 [Gaiellaceae bacterium]|nr:hypothetical protein [Gaiellaceae bacterium]